MTAIHARQALLPTGWAEDVRIEIDDWRIGKVAVMAAARPGDECVEVLLPGLPNLHSHAFQRGMAGLAERPGPSADNFWTWRDTMYRFALAMTPDDMQAVAAMAYMEMLEAGFTRVGEFHYLHHGPAGSRYAVHAEMSFRIIAAAEATGINLTHLPVFYAHGDFGGAAPRAGQRRFLNTVDEFLDLMELCRVALRRPMDRLGIAPHSLRAVTAEELSLLVAAHDKGPIHIHVAEQMREVEDCLRETGQRPVQWLLANMPVDKRWCLIHATHITETERQGMLRAGTVAGLCPITEANLGDGLFPAASFMEECGAWGVGSDSNVEINAAGELRLLEYGQRLARQQRNVMAARQMSTGATLYQSAVAGGAQALGAPAGAIASGAPADLAALQDPVDLGSKGEQALDRWIFAAGLSVSDVWASGRRLVAEGRHKDRQDIVTAYQKSLKRLLA